MKEIVSNLNKAFENRIRLGIMSILMVNEWVDFITLKNNLDITDGNLASHLLALEKINFINFSKGFIGRKPNTRYQATEAGKIAFAEHIKYLEQIVNKHNK